MLTVYLAGPEVFLPDAIELGDRKKRLCAAYGFEGPFPARQRDRAGLFRRAPRPADLPRQRGHDPARPFRHLQSPHRSAASAPIRERCFEVGDAVAGLGKRVFAYTNVAPDYFDRTKLTETLVLRVQRETSGGTPTA